MPTQETKKIITNLLNQANTAIVGQQWNTVHVLAEEILKLDESNEEALSFKTTAMRILSNTPILDRTLRPDFGLTVLPDPNIPKPPPDPDDAIYYSLSGAHFNPADPDRAHAYGFNGLISHGGYTSAWADAPLNLLEGVQIWGWRCNVSCTGGSMSALIHGKQFDTKINFQVGAPVVTNTHDDQILTLTGLNHIVNNKENSYFMTVRFYREEHNYDDLRLNSAVIICKPS